VFIAGDGAGIGAGKAAAILGEIAAREVVHDLGPITQYGGDAEARPLQRQFGTERAARPFIDRAMPLFRPL
jgi:hypothetical protein